MALDRTAGYDMLIQVSEAEINAQLATAFLSGSVFPSALTVPIASSGVAGNADINFATPVADLDRTRPQLGLTVPFTNSQLRIDAPIPLTVAPLGGTIVIVDSIGMVAESGGQRAVIDFTTGAPSVTVTFDSGSVAQLDPLLTAAGLTLTQAQNLVAGVVLNELQSDIGRIELTPLIPVSDDADATTIFDIDVSTVNDSSTLDRDCISFGVRMSRESGGNIAAITQSFIPSGGQSLVMMSNFWLLARAMRPRIASALGRSVSDFDTPLRLNRSIPAPGGEGTLTNLEARVIGNRIQVTGRATDSGTGWSAESNFSFFVDIALSGGEIIIAATTPNVDTDVDLEWWVWLVSLGLGGLFGGIIGAIVAAIVLAIVEAVAEGVADGLISEGVSGALGGLPSIPLGPIGGGLTMTSIILDDLELRSNIVHSLSVPVRNRGSHVSHGGFAIDLDTGTVSPSAVASSDLVWSPVTGFTTSGPGGLTVTGTSYGSLMPATVSRMPLASNQIATSLVPYSFSPSEAFLPVDAVVFGIRTSDGRLARARAWRAREQGNALRLEWTTWDTPAPSLDIARRWSVLERGEVTESITPDCAFCRSSPVSRCGVFEAWPRLAAFPVDYQWCLCGEVLEGERGEVDTSDGPLAWRIEGRRLFLETEMGQAVDCELCVSAIDAREMELFTCIRINISGIEQSCHVCDPNRPIVFVEFLEVEPVLATWRPLIANFSGEGMETVGMKRLSRLR